MGSMLSAEERRERRPGCPDRSVPWGARALLRVGAEEVVFRVVLDAKRADHVKKRRTVGSCGVM